MSVLSVPRPAGGPTATTTATTTGTPTGYVRRISPIEKGYLSTTAQGCTNLIQTVVDGVGHLETAAVRAAVEVATRVNPGLAVVRRGAFWRAEGPVPPVVEHPFTGAGDAFDHPFHHEGLDAVAGPVAAVGVFRGDGVTRLVVKASHLVTDGRGVQRWMADVFRVLRGEEPEGSPDTLHDRHFVEAAGKLRPVAELPRAVFPAVFGTGDVRSDATAWVRRSLPGRAPAMTARIAVHLARRAGADVRVLVPVDLRRHDRSVRSTANLSAQLPLDVGPGTGWERVHGLLLAAMARKQEVARLARDFRANNPFATSLTELLGDRDRLLPCTAIVSDHGVHDLARFATRTFSPQRLFTLPMLVPYADVFTTCFATGNGTELTVAHRDRAGARQDAESFLDDVAAELRGLPGTPS